MTDGSKILLYVFVGGPVLLGLFFLFLMGPVGWFLAGFVVLAVMVLRSFSEDETEQTPDKTNCAACGAPNPRDRETCQYCDEAL